MSDRFLGLIRRLAQSVEDDYSEAVQHAREKDPQRSGHEGEATWSRLLEAWGPSWPVATRRYIVGPGGDSNEVDLLLLKPDYPKHLRNENSVLASGVAAAFSCKTTLKSAHIREALDQKQLLLQVASKSKSDAKACLCGPFPYGLLAHSTSLSQSSGDLVGGLDKTYQRIARDPGNTLVSEPAGELDALLVADTAFLFAVRNSLSPLTSAATGEEAWLPSSAFASHHDSPGYRGTPLAQFVVWLNRRLGGDSLRDLADMFGASSYSGSANYWPLEIYPDHIRAAVRTALLNEYGNPLSF